MKLFLDTSVLIAAVGSERGGSHLLFKVHIIKGWKLLTSHYCFAEVLRNLNKLKNISPWEEKILPFLEIVDDVFTLDKPLVFPISKDKPPLFSALAAEADFFLTLDRTDFQTLLGKSLYHMHLLTPAEFLLRQRQQEKI
ncbi:MAG: hypothetical protein K1X66_09110 [Verrucomicrobiae bacterium]|nr:hypothetical protein [Verrucomicrobiae bacterium]